MEIELKFLIQASETASFFSLMAQSPYQVESHPSRALSNAYYDTPDNDLRQWDFGLRSRTSMFDSGEGWSEQTVKLAGQDIGGLHQRPEYTIKFDHANNCFADLTKFEADIWPQGFHTHDLQGKLEKIFETEFHRQIWLVTMPSGTQVECVFDSGQVLAQGRSEPISEIELELVQGQVDDVFQFAFYLSSQLELKLGSQSKAARGYMLAADKQLTSSNLDPLPVTGEDSIESSLTQGLTKAVQFIQHNELVLARTGSPKALRRVLDGVSFLIHVLKLHGDLLKGSRCESFLNQFKAFRRQNEWVNLFYQLQQLTARKSAYRKDIENSEYLHDLLAEHQMSTEKMEQAQKQFYQADFNRLMLSFLKWLSQKEWRQELTLNQLDHLSLPLRSVATDWLNRAWEKLLPPLIQFNQESGANGVEKVYWPLATELLTGLCVGNVYGGEDRIAFRNNLLDLLLGLDEMMLLKTLNNLLLEDDNEKAEKHQIWVKGKQQSLITALSVSVSHVVKLRPYW